MKKPSKALQDKWNKKLAASGFEDLEDSQGRLKSWHSHYWSARYLPLEFEAIEEYYNQAQQILNEYNFKTKYHKKIWELHTQGYTYKEIGKMLGKHLSTVHRIAVRILDDYKNKKGK